jgi:ABC-2 type transport system permease protein
MMALLARLSPSPATRVVLAHEARLALRGFADMAGPASPARPWRIAAVLAVMSLIALGVSHVLLQDAGPLDPRDPRVQLTLSINLAFLFVLMAAAALDSAAYALYARGDYDLMFSAPLSPRTVLLVRALNVFGVTVAKALLYGAPMLALLAFQRGPHWLAGLPLILALALAATALAIGMAMGLVRLVGVRGARSAAQIVAALAGLLVLVMVQWDAIFGPGPKDALLAAFAAGPPSWAWLAVTAPARAMTGDVGALVGLGALSMLLAAVMFMSLGERFVRNAVLAAGSDAAPTKAPRRSRASFGASPFATLMLKERRIVLRDPWLMSQILMQCIFLLPIAAATIYRVATGADNSSMLAPVLIVLCGQIAGGLTWIALSADEASELAMTAPLDPRLRSRARLAAVAWLAAIFAAAPLMLVLAFDPWTGLVSLLGVACAIPCGILVNLWHQPKLARAGLIRRRMKSPVTVTVMELGTLSMVAVAAWPLLGGQYGLSAASALVVAAIMTVLYAARRREVT